MVDRTDRKIRLEWPGLGCVLLVEVEGSFCRTQMVLDVKGGGRSVLETDAFVPREEVGPGGAAIGVHFGHVLGAAGQVTGGFGPSGDHHAVEDFVPGQGLSDSRAAFVVGHGHMEAVFGQGDPFRLLIHAGPVYGLVDGGGEDGVQRIVIGQDLGDPVPFGTDFAQLGQVPLTVVLGAEDPGLLVFGYLVQLVGSGFVIMFQGPLEVAAAVLEGRVVSLFRAPVAVAVIGIGPAGGAGIGRLIPEVRFTADQLVQGIVVVAMGDMAEHVGCGQRRTVLLHDPGNGAVVKGGFGSHPVKVTQGGLIDIDPSVGGQGGSEPIPGIVLIGHGHGVIAEMGLGQVAGGGCAGNGPVGCFRSRWARHPPGVRP